MSLWLNPAGSSYDLGLQRWAFVLQQLVLKHLENRSVQGLVQKPQNKQLFSLSGPGCETFSNRDVVFIWALPLFLLRSLRKAHLLCMAFSVPYMITSVRIHLSCVSPNCLFGKSKLFAGRDISIFDSLRHHVHCWCWTEKRYTPSILIRCSPILKGMC